MIRDLERERPVESAASDVCIVGAGAAGILLAVELARMGKRVTLLEGGGLEIEPESQQTYASELGGLPHKGLHEGRFRALGGTTTKWGGQILEFDTNDFAARSWVPGSGWPLGKSVLQPFYERALALEGLGAVRRVDADVWTALGLGVPGFDALEPYFSRWCPEPNFARLHAAALRDATGLEVWLHSNAVELLLDGEQAVGVRARTLSGAEHIFKAGEYVFCLGAIESSRFFLQPRVGALPWNRSGLLGSHFQDHIDANAASVVPHSPARFHELFDNVFLGGLKYHPKLHLAAGLQQEHETLNVAATMLFESDADETLANLKGTAKHLLRGRVGEVKARDVGALAANLPALLRQTWRYAVAHRAWNPPGAKISLRVHCEQEPLSASSISLAETRDALGLLRTRLDWRIADPELETIRVFVDAARESLRGVAEIIPEPTLGTRLFTDRCDDSNHHMGGMRMAASEAAGVVDTDLRLYGSRNVYVGSSAVFPTSGYSNPTHTLLALMMRLAEHLR